MKLLKYEKRKDDSLFVIKLASGYAVDITLADNGNVYANTYNVDIMMKDLHAAVKKAVLINDAINSKD